MKRIFAALWIAAVALAAGKQALPPLPQALAVPKAGPDTGAPYAPQAILQGGIVVPLYRPDAKTLNKTRLHEPEVYTMSTSVPGRINSVVNVHNPSLEFHPVDSNLNTGALVILIPGGGHRFLNVGTEGADFVPFFYNYGVNTAILRNRLRSDGYNPQADGVEDVMQAIRMARAYAKEWHVDPHKIGVMGFSAGGELASFAAVVYNEQVRAEGDNQFAEVSARPDFAGVIYPGPTPFAPDRKAPALPTDVPPVFIATGGSGDKPHAEWSLQFFHALLAANVPNIEMHIYGVGRHPGDPLPDGSHMSGGLTDRNGTPFGTWQDRFVEWFRNLGFLKEH